MYQRMLKVPRITLPDYDPRQKEKKKGALQFFVHAEAHRPEWEAGEETRSCRSSSPERYELMKN